MSAEPVQRPSAEPASGAGLPIPRPPSERRERRKAVESMMLAGASTWRCMSVLSRSHGVHPRTIRSDVRLIERRWAQDDAGDLARTRTAVLRRLSRVAGKAERAGDFGAAVTANVALGRFLGLTVKAELDVHATVRGRVEHEVRIESPSAWMAEMMQGLHEVGMLVPALERLGVPVPLTLPARVVDAVPVPATAGPDEPR